MGHIGHELPAHLLVFPLGSHIVDDHQGAAALPAAIKGGQQQLEKPVPDLELSLQMVGGLQHLI